ncbi:hypothetical protein G5714_019202 [Onychostoma macrolepis]|uniref:Uncharacterized protein n=1 Tax=Onychostoma macrolepis TaxID=369639 RepID=A0A7J6C1A3_9TELE|nr:hypothetical protein G5714_019202 [Onychostoma macrolepis]
MKVWSRTDGGQCERMTISDGNLIISNFIVRDAGSYRVLDSDEEPLITVTVTETKEKLDDTDKDKTDATKYRSYWIVLTLVLLVLIVTAVTLLGVCTDFTRRVSLEEERGTEYRRPEALRARTGVC